ncbi:MAG TPA: hypothetical protein VIP98_13695 [Microlunatus sp.]
MIREVVPAVDDLGLAGGMAVLGESDQGQDLGVRPPGRAISSRLSAGMLAERLRLPGEDDLGALPEHDWVPARLGPGIRAKHVNPPDPRDHDVLDDPGRPDPD